MIIIFSGVTFKNMAQFCVPQSDSGSDLSNISPVLKCNNLCPRAETNIPSPVFSLSPGEISIHTCSDFYMCNNMWMHNVMP